LQATVSGSSGSAPLWTAADRVERDTKAHKRRVWVRTPPAPQLFGPSRPLRLPCLAASLNRLWSSEHDAISSEIELHASFEPNIQPRRFRATARLDVSLSALGRGSRGRASHVPMRRPVRDIVLVTVHSFDAHARATTLQGVVSNVPKRGNLVLALQDAIPMNECITPY
jgi:hypothetical protein